MSFLVSALLTGLCAAVIFFTVVIAAIGIDELLRELPEEDWS